MSNISTYRTPSDMVRVQSMNTYIEARGDNARMIAGAFAIMLICIGLAALTKAA